MQFITGRIVTIENKGYITTVNGDFLSLFFVITKRMDKKKRNIGFNCYGKLAEKVSTYNLKDKVEVQYIIDTNKYNDKWFTNLKAKTVDRVIDKPKKNYNQIKLIEHTKNDYND